MREEIVISFFPLSKVGKASTQMHETRVCVWNWNTGTNHFEHNAEF